VGNGKSFCGKIGGIFRDKWDNFKDKYHLKDVLRDIRTALKKTAIGVYYIFVT